MRNGITKITFLFAFLTASQTLFAQTESSGNNIFVISIVIVAILLIMGVILNVADNLLTVEAKQTGVDETGANFSIFPRWSEILAPRLPKYLNGEKVRILRKGHDILLEGNIEEVESVETVMTKTYAVQPPNFNGIAPIPKLLVEEGAEVKAGDALFFDKNNPDIKFVAPVSGEIASIRRGAKRSIAAIVILADKEIKYQKLKPVDPEKASREELVNFLMESGAWALIRQRPFNIIADPNEVPRDIFISTFDSAPLAPDLNLAVAGNEDAFQKGLDVLTNLTSGSVHLGLDANGDQAPSTAFTEAANVEKHWFKGKHPAGNVGVQIHHIAPIAPAQKVWTLGVQEVITLGTLFLEGKYAPERLVALTGGELEAPKYVRTPLGANLGDLLANNIKGDNCRIISGDVLSGEQKTGEDFLNYYDDQVTVITEGDYHEPFGWLLALKPRPSVSRSFPGFLFPSMRFDGDTNTHGEQRAFVVTGQYESVLPMDIYPQHLMKSIMIGDFERMEGLGLYELVEEDVALCEFACTSKQPLQQILRDGLDMLQEQG